MHRTARMTKSGSDYVARCGAFLYVSTTVLAAPG